MSSDVLKSKAGKALYRHLPEEYRYRDPAPAPGELGDLEALLHGPGAVLDALRETLEQAYADGFAEEIEGRGAQGWMLPYLAELLGTTLVAPDLDGTASLRRDELNEAVSWSKGKGTLRVADRAADVLTGAEVVMVEGWQKVTTTPRLSLPPFARSASGRATPDQFPVGLPDLRKLGRAVLDTDAIDPRQKFNLPGPERTTVGWRVAEKGAAPCFPGAFSDDSRRLPDIRTTAPRPGRLGPAPRRVMAHVQPPEGFFHANVQTLPLTLDHLADFIRAERDATGARIDHITPDVLRRFAGVSGDAARVSIRGGLTNDIQDIGDWPVTFTDINFTTAFAVDEPSLIRLERCAMPTLISEEAPADRPNAILRDCLIGSVLGGNGFVEMEYCTVLGDAILRDLRASDCLIMGSVIDEGCLGPASCIRFSRLNAAPEGTECNYAAATTNTNATAFFAQRPLPSKGAREGADSCTVRAPGFGETGAGVLDLGVSRAIAEGAEDGGELGCYHHLGHLARFSALRQKLIQQLPLGQDLELIHDPMLAVAPPKLL